MYTIYDYIRYYKNISVADIGWNEIDNLLCSILVYMPNSPFDEEISLEELLKRIDDTELVPDTWLMAPKVKEISLALHNSKRYKDLRISHFKKEISERTQFGAVTFTLGKVKVISFEGSDGTVISWKENLRLAYMYPVSSQELALEYIKENITDIDTDVYLVGHSKGGNLAMSACYEADDLLYSKIKKVYNFDGPGFLKEEYENPKFSRMSKKLINIIPKGSYIGVLMYNNLKYVTVNSNESGALVHYPTSWEVFGTTFAHDKMNKRSKYLLNITSKGFDDLNREQTGKVIESIFKDNFLSYDSKMRMNFKQVKKALDNAKEYDIRILGILKECFSVLTVEPVLHKKKRKTITK